MHTSTVYLRKFHEPELVTGAPCKHVMVALSLTCMILPTSRSLGSVRQRERGALESFSNLRAARDFAVASPNLTAYGKVHQCITNPKIGSGCRRKDRSPHWIPSSSWSGRWRPRQPRAGPPPPPRTTEAVAAHTRRATRDWMAAPAGNSCSTEMPTPPSGRARRCSRGLDFV